MPRLHGGPQARTGTLRRRVAHVSAALLLLPVKAATDELPKWTTTTPQLDSRRLGAFSTTTNWATTKTTVTAPGTWNLERTANLTHSQQSLATQPWMPAGHGGPCTSRFRAPPTPPAVATDLNGISLPDTCFTGAGPHHVFVIGDWGGVFNGATKPIMPADRRSKHMPSHHRPFVMGADDCAQQNVARQMKARSLKSLPDYVLNVGDNFYWGGVLVKCGGPPAEVHDPVGQWTWVFEKMYDGPGLAGKQWLGVLGNHDFGGFLFTHGWDQAIGYTWARTPTSTDRWVTPALYWKAKVNYPDFSVDYYFVDTNSFDAGPPDSDPGHNLCSRKHNQKVGSTCGIQGPVSIDECPTWFRRLWLAQIQWMKNALSRSSANWQIVVTHFPPIRGWGADVWQNLARQFGIDIIISGHVHRQEVHYMDHSNRLAPTAYIISGGGGGITSEDMPDADGYDDQYGFVDLTLTAKEIRIEALSHGGQLRSLHCVTQRLRGAAKPARLVGPSLCDEPPTTTGAPTTTAPPTTPAPTPAPAPPAPAQTTPAPVPRRPAAPPPAAGPRTPRPQQPAARPSPPATAAPGASGAPTVSGGGGASPAAGGWAGKAPTPRYTFVGFAGPVEARGACGAGQRLAAPRTSAQRRALLAAMAAALREGYMSATWPENTIWLGGRWSASTRQWTWDDGTAIPHLDWATGEPSSTNHQEREPWLCMVLDGQVRDTDPPYSFGVFCEDEAAAPAPRGAGPAAAGALSGGPSQAAAAAEVPVLQTSASSEENAAEAEANDGASTQGIMQDIAAAIETDSWNSIQVHTPLPARATLHGPPEQDIMKKDATLDAGGLARLLLRRPSLLAAGLTACAATAVAALAALGLFAAARCRRPGQRATPGTAAPGAAAGTSQPLVAYEQLHALQEPPSAEAA